MTSDGPPIFVSDEWQQRYEAVPPSEVEVDAPTSPKTPLYDDEVDGQPDLYDEAPEPTVLIPVMPEKEGEGPTDDPEPTDPVDDDHAKALAGIESQLDSLRSETVHLNEILDRLHAENERLRRGESQQLLQPLFRDLLKLADDWTAMATSWEAKESATPADVARKCRDVAEDAGLILERYGLDAFTPAIGSPMDRRQHRIVGTVRSEGPDADNTVAEVRRSGYVYEDKVVKFAEVIVAKA